MVSDPPRPRRAWLIVGLLWFVVLSNYLARLLPTSMHGSLVAAIPMSEAQFGLLTSCLFWTYGLMSPFSGFLADRLGRSRVILASLFCWSAITWLTSFARTFDQLIILRSLMGVSEACYMPAALALIADYHKGSTRSLATGIHQSGYNLGLGLSGLGGWLADERSWHFAFSVIGLTGLVYFIPAAFLLRDPPREIPSVAVPAAPKVRLGEAVKCLFGVGSFIVLLVIHGLLNVLGWSIMGWLPVFLQETYHLSQGSAGLSASGYMQVAAVPGLLIGGLWADKWSRSNRRARMYVAGAGLLISAPGVVMAANVNVFSVAILGFSIYGLTQAFYDANLMPSLCEIVDSRYRATGYGLMNMNAMIAAGFGMYFSGLLRDLKIDLRIVFDLGAVFTVVCAGLFLFVRPASARGTDEARSPA